MSVKDNEKLGHPSWGKFLKIKKLGHSSWGKVLKNEKLGHSSWGKEKKVGATKKTF